MPGDRGAVLFPRNGGAHPIFDQRGEEAGQSDRDPSLRIRMNDSIEGELPDTYKFSGQLIAVADTYR